MAVFRNFKSPSEMDINALRPYIGAEQVIDPIKKWDYCRDRVHEDPQAFMDQAMVLINAANRLGM